MEIFKNILKGISIAVGVLLLVELVRLASVHG